MRTLSFAFAGLVALTLATTPLIHAEEPPAPDALPSIFEPLQVEAGGNQPPTGNAAFILEIRQRLGLNPLKGTILDTPAAKPAFVAELKRIEQQQAATPTTPHLPPLPQAITASTEPMAPKIRMYDADPALVDSLRAAAREIDRKANDWETQNEFERADYLRGVANQIRGIARQHAAVK